MLVILVSPPLICEPHLRGEHFYSVGRFMGDQSMATISPINWQKQRKLANTLAKFIDQWTARAHRQAEERRKEKRVALSVPMYLVPLHEGTPLLSHGREVISKDFSSSGIGLFTDVPIAAAEVLLILPYGNDPVCLRAKKQAITPAGSKHYQLGLEIVEELRVSDVAGLKDLDSVLGAIQSPLDQPAPT
jgi:hypothetical protein